MARDAARGIAIKTARYKTVLRVLRWVVIPVIAVVELAWRYRDPGLAAPETDILAAWIAFLGLTLAVAVVAAFVKRARYRWRTLWLVPAAAACGYGVALLLRGPDANIAHFAAWTVAIAAVLGALALTDPRGKGG